MFVFGSIFSKQNNVLLFFLSVMLLHHRPLPFEDMHCYYEMINPSFLWLRSYSKTGRREQ